MPVASMATSSWPGPGVGRGADLTCSPSGSTMPGSMTSVMVDGAVVEVIMFSWWLVLLIGQSLRWVKKGGRIAAGSGRDGRVIRVTDAGAHRLGPAVGERAEVGLH